MNNLWMEYLLVWSPFREKGVLRGNRIVLGSGSGTRNLDKYTFSHALSLSVKLGALEATLDDFVKQIEHIHEVRCL
jgi:uncharacterized Rmd1/YagE family protein